MMLHLTGCLALLGLLAQVASAQTGKAPDVNSIVDRMMAALQENRAHLRAFTVKRHYQLLDKQSQPKAEIVAEITYHPPGPNQYHIERSSGGMGEKVLRDILTKDTETTTDTRRRDLSRDNYDFQFLREDKLDGSRCYVLAMVPKRDEKELVRGQVWVDAQSYKIRRVEGKPMKSPSWWLRDTSILMTFADVNGMWLRTATYAVSSLRFKGQYTMVSRDIEYHAPKPPKPAKSTVKNEASLAGTAVVAGKKTAQR
jgi:outer membrane lipoprotein-sorting protein